MNWIERPIIITGCARSGTSMTAGIVDACGGFGGLLSGPTRYNPRGFFENLEIRNSIVKPYLTSIGMDPLGQNPIPADMDKLPPFPQMKGRIQDVIRWNGYKADDPRRWYYKCAKACLFWPLWVEAFPDATWIVVRRKDEDIVNSCLRTGFMRGYSDAAGWQGWVDEHKKRFAEMEKVVAFQEVWPTKWVEGDYSEIKDVIWWAGLEWNDEKVRQFIAPELWHGGGGHGEPGDV